MSLVAVIPAAAARRIVASAALLRSPHDGEVLAAARAVERLLSPHGVHLDALVEAALQPSCGDGLDRPRPNRRTHQDAARWCLGAGYWNSRERDFLLSMTRPGGLSPRQSDWLKRLCDRRGRGA